MIPHNNIVPMISKIARHFPNQKAQEILINNQEYAKWSTKINQMKR